MNVVFDLGGVVVAWKPEEIIANAFADPAARAIVRREIFEHPDWLDLDRGTLALDDAIARAARRTGLPEADVMALMRSVPPALVVIPETVELLYRVKAAGHMLYCLSNMQVASIDHLEKTYSFWDVFSGEVFSCRVGACKPEPVIYEYLLNTYSLHAGDTVFIDDTDMNLTAAAEFGIRTIKFESAAQCERELLRIGGVR